MASKIVGSTAEVESGKIIEDTSLSIEVKQDSKPAAEVSAATPSANAAAVPKQADKTEDSYPTVFVRKIADRVTDEELRVAFSRYGIVKEAVVVRNTRTGLNRGFGFVHFATTDAVDAAIADTDAPILRDTRVTIEKADPKNVLYCGHIPSALSEDEVRAQIERIAETPLVRFELCVHASGRSKSYGWARFLDHNAALQALEKLNKTPFASTKPTADNTAPAALDTDKPLMVRMAEPRVVDPRVMKAIRALYVRNVNPECSKKEIRDAFGGKDRVERVFIPLHVRTRKPLGTAVVHYKQRKNAEEYLTRMDGAELRGRKLHVEWCLPEESTMSHSAKLKLLQQQQQKAVDEAASTDPDAASASLSKAKGSGAASSEPMYVIPVGYRSPLYVPVSVMSQGVPTGRHNKAKKHQEEQIQMPIEKPEQETQLLPVYGYFIYPPPQMPLYPPVTASVGHSKPVSVPVNGVQQPSLPKRQRHSHRKHKKVQGSSKDASAGSL